MRNRQRICAIAVLVAFGATGCSSLKSMSNKGASLANKADSAAKKAESTADKGEDTAEEADVTKLTMKGKGIKSSVDMVRKKCPVDKTPFEWAENPEYAIDQCKMKSERINKQVKKFPVVDEPKPDAKACVEYAKKLTNALPEWEKKLAEIKAKRKADEENAEAFEEAVNSHDGILGTLYSFNKEKSISLIRTQKVLLGNVEKAKALDDFAKECDEKGWREVSSFYSGARAPENACDLAAEWKPTFLAYVNAMVKKEVDKKSGNMTYWVKALREKGQLYPGDRKKLEDAEAYTQTKKDKYKPVYSALGQDLPAKLFAPLLEANKGYPDALKAASKENRWPKEAKYKDGQMKSALKRAISDAGLSFKKYGLTHADWTIKKNGLGVPLYRIRDSYVLTKAKGDGFCRMYKLTGKAQYDGSGYTKPVISLDADSDPYVVTSCQ